MKQEIKVGDWVKLETWQNFYEVVDISLSKLWLDRNTGYSLEFYPLTYNWIIKEKEQHMKIDMNKKYRRVGTHEPVRVICVDRKDSEIPCIGLYLTKNNTEGVLYFDHKGTDVYDTPVIEETPAVDWSKVEVDTLIWVNGRPRYFAKYSDYMVYYFTDGTTSKTNVTGVCMEFSHNCSLEEPR